VSKVEILTTQETEESISLGWIVENLGFDIQPTARVEQFNGTDIVYSLHAPDEAMEVIYTLHEMAFEYGGAVTGFFFHPLKRFECDVNHIDFLQHNTIEFMRDQVIVCLNLMESCHFYISSDGTVRVEVKYRDSLYVVMDWQV
jgi:hypothetical protein